ncbi:MAG: pentapeptide repeat-containing protein [Salinigranum sp.]
MWHVDSAEKSVDELAAEELRPGERLDGADLRGLSFEGVDWLADRVFVGADFSHADVSGADLGDADLRKTCFSHATARGTSFEGANLEDADVSDTDLRDADLRRARLDETDLSSSRINAATDFGPRAVYEREMLESDDAERKSDKLEAAVRTYRAVEGLSEENTMNERASTYYRKGKDLRRRYNWQTNDYPKAVVGEASRLFTGYGNLPWRVIATSIGVMLLSAALYPLTGGVREARESGAVVYTFSHLPTAAPGHVVQILVKSLFFSVVTFTTLGYGNFQPVGTIAQYLASSEALVGTVLMSLLVAVLTRSAWLR